MSHLESSQSESSLMFRIHTQIDYSNPFVSTSTNDFSLLLSPDQRFVSYRFVSFRTDGLPRMSKSKNKNKNQTKTKSRSSSSSSSSPMIAKSQKVKKKKLRIMSKAKVKTLLPKRSHSKSSYSYSMIHPHKNHNDDDGNNNNNSRPSAKSSFSFSIKDALKKKTSKKKPQYVLQPNFPDCSVELDLLLKKTPWFHKEGQFVENKRNTNDAIQERMDMELMWFHKYCTLRSVESEARQYIVDCIQNICTELFGQDAMCVNYGSFATASICTFSSDVDLALFGVVPADDGTMPQYENEVSELDKEEGLDLCDDVDNSSQKSKESNCSLHSNNVLDDNDSSPLFFLDCSRLDDSNVQQQLSRKVSVIDNDINVKNILQINKRDNLDIAQDVSPIIDLTGDDNHSASSSVTAKVTESDDGDSADKMENFGDDVKSTVDWTALHNDSGSEQGDDNVEVSFVNEHNGIPRRIQPATLSDIKRSEINRILKRVRNKCNKPSLFRRLNQIKHARVPILQSETTFNFEVDLSIGGHNGSDTSNLAKHYNLQYPSFAPVTVFLKILLRQANLDKPFTGGLGSYRLYVMIASYLERLTSQNKAISSPSTALLGFLKYYGVSKKKNILERNFVSCCLGEADLGGVFKLPFCLELFQQTHAILLERKSNLNYNGSILAVVVNSTKLSFDRDMFIFKSSSILSKLKSKGSDKNDLSGSNSSNLREPERAKILTIPNPVPILKKTKEMKCKTFYMNWKKRTLSEREEKVEVKSNKKRTIDQVFDGDAEADKLIKGYRLQRGPRGTLIPLKSSPPIKRTGIDDIIGKGTKMRKNKKKQSRDNVLHNFCVSMSHSV